MAIGNNIRYGTVKTNEETEKQQESTRDNTYSTPEEVLLLSRLQCNRLGIRGRKKIDSGRDWNTESWSPYCESGMIYSGSG